MTDLYYSDEYPEGVTGEALRQMVPEAQAAVMEAWFRQNYEDPANNTPYNSREGGYQWIWGGPYEPWEELDGEFGEFVDAEIIEAVAASLSEENGEWARVPRQEDFDDSLYDAIYDNPTPHTTFQNAVGIIELLIATPIPSEVSQVVLRLAFANVITALETYLSDTFIHEVLDEPHLLRRFLETTPEYQKRQVKYSDVLREAENVRDEARRYLIELVWHNLPKVQGMYTAVLGIDFGPHMGELSRAVLTRHDIVHRNGKDKDGNALTIGIADVQKVIDQTKALADRIHFRLLFPPGGTDPDADAP